MEGKIMGMDVSGINPISKTGEYFRNNVCWWHPLAHYVQEVAPEIASRCRYWHFNDGDGLNAEDSMALTTILQAEIDSGTTAQAAAAFQELMEAIPDVECRLCKGTGVENPSQARGAGDSHNGKTCSTCNGTGKERPPNACYRFSTENVQDFANFLRDSGGFVIW
jgi:hypothetical protein